MLTVPPTLLATADEVIDSESAIGRSAFACRGYGISAGLAGT